MTLPRRRFIHLAAAAATAPAIPGLVSPAIGSSGFAWVQAYPSRPVRIVVGFAHGSAADTVTRLLAPSLSQRLGQDVVIDNQTGIGGNVAAEMVVNAEPDGHTLLMVGPSNAIDATLYEKLGFDFGRDIAPVAALVRSPNVMVVSPSMTATAVHEFTTLAKAAPGALTMASAGVGTATHLAGELFQRTNAITLEHVVYRGGAGAYDDLLSGRVDVYFPPLISAIDHIKTGALRALATAALPDYEASTWFGIGVPRRTPAAVVHRLNREINAALADAALTRRFRALGSTIIAGTPAAFGQLIADETERWSKVIRLPGTLAS
jgi:tripartite-type tricarboxylate transporter receptor subunit TctC